MPMTTQLLALTFAVWAGWSDWRSRRIPNRMTVPALLMGIAVNAFFSGWTGVKFSLEGAGLALAILLPVVILRGLGAGDWKMMGALGAFVGPRGIVVILVFAIMIGGVMAIYAMIRQRRVIETLKNLWILVTGFFIFGLRPNLKVSLDNPGLIKLPFGVAAAAATAFVLSAGYFVR
ncbi:MAG: A24 family peptidase [Candidatus Acidiferrales bacterium]